MMCLRHTAKGFSLVELMITVAILSIIAAIAIPAYRGYVQTAKDNSVRANVEPLRLALEDYFLENQEYPNGGNWIPGGDKSLEASNSLGWHPDGDNNKYSYVVTTTANTYTITVTHVDDSTATTTCTRDITNGTFSCS